MSQDPIESIKDIVTERHMNPADFVENSKELLSRMQECIRQIEKIPGIPEDALKTMRDSSTTVGDYAGKAIDGYEQRYGPFDK